MNLKDMFEKAGIVQELQEKSWDHLQLERCDAISKQFDETVTDARVVGYSLLLNEVASLSFDVDFTDGSGRYFNHTVSVNLKDNEILYGLLDGARGCDSFARLRDYMREEYPDFPIPAAKEPGCECPSQPGEVGFVGRSATCPEHGLRPHRKSKLFTGKDAVLSVNGQEIGDLKEVSFVRELNYDDAPTVGPWHVIRAPGVSGPHEVPFKDLEVHDTYGAFIDRSLMKARLVRELSAICSNFGFEACFGEPVVDGNVMKLDVVLRMPVWRWRTNLFYPLPELTGGESAAPVATPEVQQAAVPATPCKFPSVDEVRDAILTKEWLPNLSMTACFFCSEPATFKYGTLSGEQTSCCKGCVGQLGHRLNSNGHPVPIE